MKTLIATLLVAIATLTIAASPALACGPYGDPVAMAEMDVEWTTEWVESSRSDLERAIAAGDVDAIGTALAEHERAVTALANAQTHLADMQTSQQDAVEVAAGDVL